MTYVTNFETFGILNGHFISKVKGKVFPVLN